MLASLAHYLTLPAPWIHRRLGYVGQSVALRSRSRRCRAAWAPHLASTRSAIVDAADLCDRRRTALILGSGLLDDVPLKALANGFARVVLVDAVHPWTACRQALGMRNVAFATLDLSGSADLLLGRGGDLTEPLAAFLGDLTLDLVVSANLLSQLPIVPADHLERKGIDPDDLGRRIVAAHLNALARFDARVCLVTDVRERELGLDGALVDDLDLLFGATLPAPDRSWSWDLAPFGETARDRRLVHDVVAFLDWTETCAGRGAA